LARHLLIFVSQSSNHAVNLSLPRAIAIWDCDALRA
jgi:hypothetical protein